MLVEPSYDDPKQQYLSKRESEPPDERMSTPGGKSRRRIDQESASLGFTKSAQEQILELLEARGGKKELSPKK